MKSWMQKFLSQFEQDSDKSSKSKQFEQTINEDKATLLFILDAYSKTLLDLDRTSSRKARSQFDDLMKSTLNSNSDHDSKIYFNLRQFFQSYRIEENTYVQKSFDEFKNIIWNFADQISEDELFEKKQEKDLNSQLLKLREAVESNSIDEIKNYSKEFIHIYTEKISARKERREKNLKNTRNSLKELKNQLIVVNKELETDHLTGAHNRRSFELQIKKLLSMGFDELNAPTLILFDIDFFKKVIDTYGHDIGDLVLKECVKMLQEYFNGPNEMVARLGGEEFVALIHDEKLEKSVKKLVRFQSQLRKEIFKQNQRCRDRLVT